MDETGLIMVPSKQPKLIAQKGRGTLPVVVAKERGDLWTIIFSFSANGKYIPSMFIFPKNARHINDDNAPAESIHTFSGRGKCNQYLVKWHFENQNKMPRVEDTPGIFRYAYEAVNRNVVNAFRKTGIFTHDTNSDKWKPNRHIFDDEFASLPANNPNVLSSSSYSNSADDSGPDYTCGAPVPENLDQFWNENPLNEPALPHSPQSTSFQNTGTASNTERTQMDIDLPNISQARSDHTVVRRPWITEATTTALQEKAPLILGIEIVEDSKPVDWPTSCENEEIEQDSVRVDIQEVQDDNDSMVLGSVEQSESRRRLSASLEASTSNDSAFSVGPFQLEKQMVNMDPVEQIVSNRTPRPKLASEHMTSDTNMEKLTTKELTKKRKTSSND
ncbi:unnamed protein product [Allacma fusca]|uniref:Uncharacterized protein n=1 Tax=Allacma fusca TaxID=39272 RepID=A0A8J2JWN8_9HEXA|nr:unnamed protein product [Allacma fusca]